MQHALHVKGAGRGGQRAVGIRLGGGHEAGQSWHHMQGGSGLQGWAYRTCWQWAPVADAGVHALPVVQPLARALAVHRRRQPGRHRLDHQLQPGVGVGVGLGVVSAVHCSGTCDYAQAQHTG